MQPRPTDSPSSTTLTTADAPPATMAARTILGDAFDRIHQQVGSVCDGADHAMLVHRADPDANTIAWLVWHLTRVQDTHLAELVDQAPAWHAEGFADHFALVLPHDATGYRATTEQVGALDGVTVDQLTGYHDAVHARTVAYLGRLTVDELDRVVDDSYDPPVTVATRLVSVIGDCLAHLGQAQYVRGLAQRAI